MKHFRTRASVGAPSLCCSITCIDDSTHPYEQTMYSWFCWLAKIGTADKTTNTLSTEFHHMDKIIEDVGVLTGYCQRTPRANISPLLPLWVRLQQSVLLFVKEGVYAAT